MSPAALFSGIPSKSPLIGLCHESFQSKDTHRVCILKMPFQAALGIEITQGPALAAQHEVCLGKPPAGLKNALCQANDLKRDLLFGGPGNLLPLEGYEKLLFLFHGKYVHDMASAADADTDHGLGVVSISTTLEGGENHGFEHGTGGSVAWRHDI